MLGIDGKEMILSDSLQSIISEEVSLLSKEEEYDLSPQRRLDIYNSIGPYTTSDKNSWFENIGSSTPFIPSRADRVRIRVSMLTAQKVLPLWEAACRETDLNFAKKDSFYHLQRKERKYLKARIRKSIEHVSVHHVPRKFVVNHITEMGNLMFNRQVRDFSAFKEEANEWWQMYPRPERMGREYCVKWACQEYLYETLGWNRFFEEIRIYTTENEEIAAHRHTDAPAGHALIAYAGVFDPLNPGFDNEKRRDFWRWWLTETIPRAWQLEPEESI
jgi:hypothetical protein